MFLEAVDSPGTPLGTWGAVKPGAGAGGAENPLLFSGQPCTGAWGSLCRWFLQEQKAVPRQREGVSPCNGGRYRLPSASGREDCVRGRSGGTAKEPPHHPESLPVPQKWQQVVGVPPPPEALLFRPRLNQPSSPPCKVL